MDKETKTEIDTLHQMVQNWKKGYLSHYSTDGVNEWILEDFTEEINTILLPYVTRLFETDYITALDRGNFYDRLKAEIDDLRRLLGLSITESEGEDTHVCCEQCRCGR